MTGTLGAGSFTLNSVPPEPVGCVLRAGIAKQHILSLPALPDTSLVVPYFCDDGTTTWVNGLPTSGTAGFLRIINAGPSSATVYVSYCDIEGNDQTPSANSFILNAGQVISWRPTISDPVQEPSSPVPDATGGMRAGSARIFATGSVILGDVSMYHANGDSSGYTMPSATGSATLAAPLFEDTAAAGALLPTTGAVSLIGVQNVTGLPVTFTIRYTDAEGNDRTPSPNQYTLQAYSSVAWRPVVSDTALEGTRAPVPDMVSAPSGRGAVVISAPTASLAGCIVQATVHGVFAYELSPPGNTRLAAPIFIDNAPDGATPPTAGTASRISLMNTGSTAVSFRSTVWSHAAGATLQPLSQSVSTVPPRGILTWRPLGANRPGPSQPVSDASGSVLIELNSVTVVGRMEMTSADGSSSAYALLPGGTALATPSAPGNPGATAVGTGTITWTWLDISANETGFKVFDDPGSGPPTTLQTTTAANVTSWPHSGLSPNTQYSCQVCATSASGDSAKTPNYTAYTLAAVPRAPLVSGPGVHSLNVAIGSGDGNPAWTLYGIQVSPAVGKNIGPWAVGGNTWVQADGTVGANPVYRTATLWGTKMVTGLAEAAPYSFNVIARNGDGIDSPPGPAGNGTTLTGTRTLTTAVRGGGGINPPAGPNAFTWKQAVQVTATAAAGWLFDHWEGALAGSQNPSTVIMDTDKSVTAVFVQLGAERYYVSPGGSDNNDGLTPGSALASIQKAIDLANAGVQPGSRSTVVLLPGAYQSPNAIHVKSGVNVVGSGAFQTTIQTTAVSPSGQYFGVILDPDTSLGFCTILLPGNLSGETPAILVYVPDAGTGPVFLGRCLLDGRDNPGLSAGGVRSVGVEVHGGHRYSVTIAENWFTHLTTGLIAVDSGVNVTRNVFRDIGEDAIVAASSGKDAKQSGVSVPLLGDANDTQNTGLNTFLGIGRYFVNNQTGEPIQAQGNDWGVYDQAEIAQGINGAADSSQFLGKGIGPGSIVVSVQDTSGVTIPESANPLCTIAGLGQTAEREANTGRLVFYAVPEGQWTVEASATGYTPSSAIAEVSALNPTPVTLQLAGGGSTDTGASGGPCGASGKTAYAFVAFAIWGAGRRYRRNRSRASRG